MLSPQPFTSHHSFFLNSTSYLSLCRSGANSEVQYSRCVCLYIAILPVSLSISSVFIKTVKFIRAQAIRSQKDRRDIALPFLHPRRWRWVGGKGHAPAAWSPGTRRGSYCTGGWVGPRAGLDEWRKSRPPPTGIRSPDLPVAIPT